MNLTTLSGVYENGRKIVRMLGSGNSSMAGFRQRLTVIAADQAKLAEFMTTVDNLESHLRVMGMENVITKEGE